MSSIVVNDQRYPLAAGTTVLDTLLQAGLTIDHGCRAGICQSCLVRATSGAIPAGAQLGLNELQKLEGWLLACQCQPQEELTLELTPSVVPKLSAQVVEMHLLAPRVMGVWLKPEQPFNYRAGQYITLWRDDEVGRSYSLASLPQRDDYLELHIALIDGGMVSSWVHHTLQCGDTVQIGEARGDCVYLEGRSEQPLLLIGTGTGLAPLYGVVRAALQQGHHGPIHFFHGARTPDYLYYRDELTALAAKHTNLHYHPSLVETTEVPPDGVEVGAIDQLVPRHLAKLDGWRVFLSGAPAIVNRLSKQCFLAGAASNEIHSDPFG